ncbi:TPA_asm: protein 3 [Holcus virus 1]|uniref:Protein 3 n=1 Tax=Holcus virus 1 TaxID=2984270 RepID=A0A9N6YIW7_9RHAB|nr:TPA_asm: protein 3 [Holcus virus 1]
MEEPPVQQTTKVPLLTAVESADEELGAFPDVEDLVEVISRELSSNPLPGPSKKRNYDTPLLITEAEDAILKSYKEKAADITKREAAIFLYGYRVRNDMENRMIGSLLRSINQTAQVIASYRPKTQNVRYASVLQYKKKAINAVLELDNKSYSDITVRYGLDIEQIYDALKDMITGVENANYWFIEPPNKWPNIIYEHLTLKCDQLGLLRNL